MKTRAAAVLLTLRVQQEAGRCCDALGPGAWELVTIHSQKASLGEQRFDLIDVPRRQGHPLIPQLGDSAIQQRCLARGHVDGRKPQCLCLRASIASGGRTEVAMRARPETLMDLAF